VPGTVCAPAGDAMSDAGKVNVAAEGVRRRVEQMGEIR